MQPYQHTSNFDRAQCLGWFLRIHRGCLRLTGKDSLAFLQALVTNDVATLQVGDSCDALYLTPQGRMITDMRVHRREEDVLISVPKALAAGLATRLDLLIFSEDVQVADATSQILEVTFVGRETFQLADAFVSADAEATTREALLADALPELSPEDFDALRIEAGRARWGVDMNEETIPLEAGLLERAISQTKGCYVGQEVIIRVLHRGGGRVAKRLMKIDFAADVTVPPAAGTPITIAGTDVGKITSSALSKSSSRVVALGYLQRDHAIEGTAIVAGSASAVVGASAS